MYNVEDDPNTLRAAVSDVVGIKEKKPGDDMNSGDMEKKTETIEEKRMRIEGYFVAPHSKVARLVKEGDLPRVMADAEKMLEICFNGRGMYPSAFSVNHAQIDDQDPLRFFVVNNGDIIVNPVIVGHTNFLEDKKEGSLSHPVELMKKVPRFNKVDLQFQLIEMVEGGDPKLTEPITTKYNGRYSEIIQHQCQQLNGSTIYQENASGMDAVGDKSIIS